MGGAIQNPAMAQRTVAAGQNLPAGSAPPAARLADSFRLPTEQVQQHQATPFHKEDAQEVQKHQGDLLCLAWHVYEQKYTATCIILKQCRSLFPPAATPQDRDADNIPCSFLDY